MIDNLLDYKRPFNISGNLKQKFTNDFDYRKVRESVIIKMKQKNDISDRDIEIAKLVFKTRFATLNQIHRYLGSSVNRSNLKKRLEKLVSYRVLNQFTLVSVDGDREEKIKIYCLDFGGRHLLAKFTTLSTEDWDSTTNLCAAEHVGENLLATEFYIRLLETCPEKVVSFDINPEFRCRDISIKANFKCTLEVQGKKINFIGDVNRDYTFPSEFERRAQRYETLLTTNTWRKYYRNEENAPVLLVFSSSDELALEAAEILSTTTRIDMKKVRLSTDERIKEALGEGGTFLKYEQKSVYEEDMVLKLARMSIFSM